MTPREIAIAICARCRKLKKTPKRIFAEAGVNPRNYHAWRCANVMPRETNLQKVYDTLNRLENGN